MSASTNSFRGTAAVLPAVVLVVLVVGGGLGTVVLQSLGLMPLVGTPALSVDAYSALGGDLWRSVALTLSIAMVSTALAAVIGLAAALTANGVPSSSVGPDGLLAQADADDHSSRRIFFQRRVGAGEH